jgi:hypothetical protein
MGCTGGPEEAPDISKPIIAKIERKAEEDP